jgi:hypothetical protein
MAAMSNDTLALADVHRVTTEVGSKTLEIRLFDHHRTAFTLWSRVAAELGRPPTLLTLDRHMDLGTPTTLAPPATSPLPTLDAFARHELAVANDDHIVAAMQAGAVGDAIIVARSHQPPSLRAFQPFVDAAGRTHQCSFAPTLASLLARREPLLEDAAELVLDIDLDCFTTRSDGHMDEVIPWDADLIDAFLQPPGAAPFWASVLARTRLVTIAREPFHCGGFERAARLWLAFSEVFFRRVLGVPAP